MCIWSLILILIELSAFLFSPYKEWNGNLEYIWKPFLGQQSNMLQCANKVSRGGKGWGWHGMLHSVKADDENHLDLAEIAKKRVN